MGLACAARPTANSMTITGRPSTKKAEDVEQHKAAAAVLAAHPWEFPDIAAADGAPGGQHDKAKAAAKAFAFLHSFYISFSVVISLDDLRAALGAEFVAPGAGAAADNGGAMVVNNLLP